MGTLSARQIVMGAVVAVIAVIAFIVFVPSGDDTPQADGSGSASITAPLPTKTAVIPKLVTPTPSSTPPTKAPTTPVVIPSSPDVQAPVGDGAPAVQANYNPAQTSASIIEASKSWFIGYLIKDSRINTDYLGFLKRVKPYETPALVASQQATYKNVSANGGWDLFVQYKCRNNSPDLVATSAFQGHVGSASQYVSTEKDQYTKVTGTVNTSCNVGKDTYYVPLYKPTFLLHFVHSDGYWKITSIEDQDSS